MVINKKDYDTKALEHFSTGPHQNIDSKNLQNVKNKVESKISQLSKELKPVIKVSLWFILYPKLSHDFTVYLKFVNQRSH